MEPISFSFKEFLYIITVNSEIFKFLELLDVENVIDISINFRKSFNEIDEKVVNNLRTWTNNDIRKQNKKHIIQVIRSYKNFSLEIQQKYNEISQQFCIDKNICEKIQILASVIKQGMNLHNYQQSLNIIKDQVNTILSEQGVDIKIKGYDVQNNIVQIEANSKVESKALKVNSAFETFINQNYEIQVVKPQIIYEPLIEQLSKKYQFVICDKKELIDISNSHLQTAQDKKKNQQQNQNEQQQIYQQQIDEQQFSQINNEMIYAYFNKSNKMNNDDNKSQKSDEDQEDDCDSQEFIMVRDKQKLNINQLSLENIADIIEKENCDKYIELSEENQTKDETDFDELVFQKYDFLFKIEENILEIYGHENGINKLNQLIEEIEQKQEDIQILNLNYQFKNVKDNEDDIIRQNEIFKNDMRHEVSFIDIKINVWPQIIIPDLSLYEQPQVPVQIFSLIKSQNEQMKEIGDKLFNITTHRMKLSNLKEQETKLLNKYKIKYTIEEKTQIYILEGYKSKIDRFINEYNKMKQNDNIENNFDI